MVFPPGVQQLGEQDFPLTVRDSVTTLPFHAGGSVTLTAGQVIDVVHVADLRRFESLQAYARGTHTGGAGAQPEDSVANFIAWGVQVGDIFEDRTITENLVVQAVIDETHLVVDDPSNVGSGDTYVLNKAVNAIAETIRKFSITADQDILVRYDGTVDETDGYDVEVVAGESYYDENVRIAVRISVKAVSASATPKVRFTAWGV